MMTSQDILSLYESMLELTGQMLLAAGNSDWDQVVELEQRCSAHVQTLREQELEHGQAPAMQGAGRDKKVAILKQLLSDDRQIRDLALPWMARLSSLMSSSSAQRRLDHAYNA